MTKNSFKLSTRLQMIANIVPKGTNFADIGADHGHLIGYLKENQIIEKGYASDNKKGPYSILKNNLKNYDIEVDLVDGIRKIPSYINCVCICGMGGDTVVSILDESKEKLKQIEYLVISSHGLSDLVRDYLYKNHFKLVKQDACFDPEPMYYEVNLFQKGEMNPDEIDIKFGKELIKNNNIYFVENIKNKINKLLIMMQNKNLPIERIDEIKTELDEYQKLLNYIVK